MCGAEKTARQIRETKIKYGRHKMEQSKICSFFMPEILDIIP